MSESTRALLQASSDYLNDLTVRWEAKRREYVKRTEEKFENSREAMKEMREEFKMAIAHLRFVKTIEATL